MYVYNMGFQFLEFPRLSERFDERILFPGYVCCLIVSFGLVFDSVPWGVMMTMIAASSNLFKTLDSVYSMSMVWVILSSTL